MDVVTLMYKFIEYSDHYSKVSGNLWQYCRDKPNATLLDSKSFKSKIDITRSIPVDGNTKNV